jgi:putative NADH-flavin reductase
MLVCLFLVLIGVLAVSAEEQCSLDGSCSSIKPLKIVVIGASDGTTGGLFTAKALDSGHYVTAVARTPSRITKQHDNLTVATGDVKHPLTLVEPMKGADVVIGAFGHREFSDTFKTTTLYSDGARAVLDAMKEAGVKKLIMITSSGTSYMPGGGIVWDFIFRPFMWRFYADMSEMELLISETDDIWWTILRPPQLMDEKVKGEAVHSVNKPATEWIAKVSRDDLASFTLDVLEQERYENKRVYVYTVPSKE